MIVILFVALAIVYYLVQYMDKKRRDRNEESQERRRNAYLNLLNAIKDKDKSNDTIKDKEHDS